jgi:hypothetical protein
MTMAAELKMCQRECSGAYCNDKSEVEKEGEKKKRAAS